MIVHRITSPQYADSVLSGEGAKLYGGRFNRPGRPVVYAAATLSLALLELLVRTGDRSTLVDFVAVTIEIDPSSIREVSPEMLPKGWDDLPVGPSSQEFGDRWLADRDSAVLRVPSVILPTESNYLLNPDHPDFSTVRLITTDPVPIDPRFLR